MTQQEMQAINHQLATQWYRGFGLEYHGVDLGRALEYEIMRVVGRVLRQEAQIAEQGENNVDGQS